MKFSLWDKEKKKINVGLAVAVFVVGALLLGAVFVFFINQWKLDIVIHGDKKITVECGEDYKDAGAVCEYYGTLIFKRHRTKDVVKEGSVKTDVPNKEYKIKYSCDFLWLHKEAVRTVSVKDTVPPKIELVTNPGAYTLPGAEYVEEGYTATDNIDGDITAKVEKSISEGVVTYKVKDSSGNECTVQRTINYNDPVPPTITLSGGAEITINAGDIYSEPGYSAADNIDGDLTSKVVVTGWIDRFSAGTYTLDYSVKDSFGNSANAKRYVTVKALPKPTVNTNAINKSSGGKVIYLTYDDGPGAYTEELLAILAKYNVKATFFVINSNPSVIAKEAAEGHSVGVHSACHNYGAIYRSEEAYFNDFNTMSRIIENSTGKKPKIFRFPGGSSNTVSRSYNVGIMSRLSKAAQDMGYQYYDWNVSSGDAGQTTSSDQVYRNVINGCMGKSVSMVLQHDIKKFSVDAVERIIIWGLNNGYSFQPITEGTAPIHHGINN